jgi:hypothetical protein
MVDRSPGRLNGDEIIADVGAGYQERTAAKATNILVTKQDVVHVNTGTSPPSWRSTPASAGTKGPFGVCMKTVAAAAAQGTLSIATEGIFYVKADGICLVGGMVQASAVTTGRVAPFAATDVTATPTETSIETAQLDRARQVGLCLGSADSWDTPTPINGTDGGYVAVDFRKGGS